MLDSMADTIAKRLADGVDAVEQSSDSQLACSLDAAADSQEDAGGEGANAGFAVAAALQRADRLQLQSGALASSEPFYKAITRILQVSGCCLSSKRWCLRACANSCFRLASLAQCT